MKLFSPAFQDKSPIPDKYTCDGRDISIPLNWQDIPAEAQTLALIMDDPDAPGGTWVHWVIYNIPANCPGLPEGQAGIQILPDGSLQGLNSWKRIGYGGPCPPGGTHRYFFKLYALHQMPPPAPGLTKMELLESLQGHIIEQVEIYGTYRRSGA